MSASDVAGGGASSSVDEARRTAEELFTLQERAQQLFNVLKDLPEHGVQWEAHYAKAFEVYTKVRSPPSPSPCPL